ncbi:unnamed protein product [Phaedon cochleariae]|uniref:UNC93-like protein n=1 Tax=Phaedon cochleariae TaxID=80249 RepID=A0A9P0GKV2_PHACE|nr:unnamed protein product [Phaedon cochleariae]
MGSLPNLHELGKEGEEQGFKPGPALGHLCGGCNGVQATTEKSKMLYKYSGHHKITKARSNPTDSNKIVYDDVMLEHMATYSPVSTRSRCNLHQQSGFKRKDSINSSIGATSVRRLLAVVRGGGSSQPGHGGTPVITRRVLIANLTIVCISHLLTSAAYLPFLALQASVSAWYRPGDETSTNITIGSFLVSGTYLVAAFFSLIAPLVLKRVSPSIVVTSCHGIMIVLYLSLLYPITYVVVPAFIVLGLVQGLLSSAQVSFLMVLSHRMTGLFHEEEEEGRQARRTCIIRRVARAFQASHDFGLILGSILSAILISYSLRISVNERLFDNFTSIVTDDCPWNSSSIPAHCHNATQAMYATSPTSDDYASLLDSLFDRTEEGRLCGAQACPVRLATPNSTLEAGFRILSTGMADTLVGVYAGACGLALVLAALGLDRIKMLVYQDPLERGEMLAILRNIRDGFRDRRLQWAAPLAVFIGLEQAFMYADFSQSYVVCTLGIHRLNLVFLAMGLLQSIAACTLSMLLRTIRRYYVVAVGFVFHGCLLMVLVLWKPTEDDPALFYVISASWGVCNAIWEMLSFTFLTGQYADSWEAAFTNAFFFRFLGFSLAFFVHGLLCNVLKLYLLALWLVVAAVTFGWLEVKLENVRKIRNITRL